MISSSRNPLVKRIRRLRQKKGRRLENAFVAEGIRVVLAATELMPDHIDTIIYAPDLLRSTTATAALAAQEARGVTCVPVTADVFRTISDRDNPVGMAAIISNPFLTLTELPLSNDAIWVAAENISDPGNLGTILRSIDAVGATGLILIGDGVDGGHPTAVKASMGTLFSVPVAIVETSEAFLAWAKHHELVLIGTSAKATDLYWDIIYRRPCVLLLGNEQQGLSESLMTAADVSVTIPMAGQASSLNIAIAGALFLYEIRRQTSEK